MKVPWRGMLQYLFWVTPPVNITYANRVLISPITFRNTVHREHKTLMNVYAFKNNWASLIKLNRINYFQLLGNQILPAHPLLLRNPAKTNVCLFKANNGSASTRRLL